MYCVFGGRWVNVFVCLNVYTRTVSCVPTKLLFKAFIFFTLCFKVPIDSAATSQTRLDFEFKGSI